MDYRLRKLLEQTYGKGILETLEQADSKDLDSMRYVVKCETCKPNIIFYETTLRGARVLFKGVKGFPPVPFHWYINAARHFVDNQFHSIRAFVVLGSDSTVLKDFSSEWKSQFAQQKLRLKPELRTPEGFRKAMLDELDYLEKRADEAYGK